MASMRAVIFLHILLAARLSVALLNSSETVYASDKFSLANSAIIPEDGIANTHSETHERLSRYGRGNESQKASLEALPPHQSKADAHTPILPQAVIYCSPWTLKTSTSFSGSAWNIHHLTTLLIASTDYQAWIVSFCRVHVGYALEYILRAITSTSPLAILISSMWLYFAGSFFFDIGHYTLHKFSKSRSRILRNIGYLHEVHHLYFNRRLNFNDRYRWQNMCFELPLELFCQLFGTWLGYLVASFANFTGPGLLSKDIFVLVMAFEVIRSTVVACMEGRDSNHKSYSPLVPKDPHTFLVGPEYHALHHVDPSSYIGSSFKVFDWILGTSASLRSRRVTIVGSLGSFGAALKRELFSESVSCVEELNFEPEQLDESRRTTIDVLKRTDILILGTSVRSDDRMDEVVELFKKHQKAKPTHSLLLPEVWYFDTSANNRSISEGQSEKIATEQREVIDVDHRRHHADEYILYRHIVYGSRIGWLNNRPEWATKIAMWWIRRGAKTVPATFDFLAFFKNTR